MNRLYFADSLPPTSTAPLLLDVEDVGEFVRSGAALETCKEAQSQLSIGFRAQYQVAAAAATQVVNPKTYDLYGFGESTELEKIDSVLRDDFLMRLRSHGITWNLYKDLDPLQLWTNTANNKPGAVIINSDIFSQSDVRVATFPLQWKLFWKHTIEVIMTKNYLNTTDKIGWHYWGVSLVENPKVDVTELINKIRSCHLLMGLNFL